MSTDKLAEQLENQRRRVDFDTFDIIVQQLISMVETGSIDVAPVYQRQFRWNNIKRSQLIESVLLGVPVPSLFMATNKDGTWELVDGVQRLSTLIQFAGTEMAKKRLSLENPLILEGLEKLDEFNELLYDELPESMKLHFLHRPIKVITLSDKSDMIVRFDLFERLNTGGVELTNQEIRACIFRGEFNKFLDKMSNNENFLKVVKLTKTQEKDGTRQECVLRFFAFLHRYKQFEHSVSDFLNEYMKDATGSFNLAKGQKTFQNTFLQLSKVLPDGIVRGPKRKITPINLFEGVSVGAALALQKTDKLNRKNTNEWLGSNELKKYTTGATNNRQMVKGRIEFCRDKFLGK